MTSWHFTCPYCNSNNSVELSKRKSTFQCPFCNHRYLPPSPFEQITAFVDEHDWFNEMENAARQINGNAHSSCTVPGCFKYADTLDHRLAYAKGGKTCVSNLFPMCMDCNNSKDDQDYNTWLKTKTT